MLHVRTNVVLIFLKVKFLPARKGDVTGRGAEITKTKKIIACKNLQIFLFLSAPSTFKEEKLHYQVDQAAGVALKRHGSGHLSLRAVPFSISSFSSWRGCSTPHPRALASNCSRVRPQSAALSKSRTVITLSSF